MRKKIFLLTVVIVIGFLVWKSWGFWQFLFPTATRVILHPNATLQQVNGKTNVLLLGIGGGTHDGPDLTDTIMLASIDWQKNKVTLVSIPRDLWVPDLAGPVKKINSAYADGEESDMHKGLALAKAVAQEVTGVSIQYSVRLDFGGFIQAIDEIGGIDVTVARPLDDYNYPIEGKEDDMCGHSSSEVQTFTATASADTDTFAFFPCRFKHLHFDAGPQHMDGQTALEFVRSRHALGIEGSDFARSARQQLVIEAVRNKLIASAFFNPGKIIGLYSIIKDSIDTDINQQDLGLFLEKLPVLKSAAIASAVIDYGDYTTGRPGLLVNAPISSEYDYAATLIPRVGDGDFSEIQKFVQCEITKGGCKVSPLATPTP